ncbi:GntR family transcriptional regulator [Oceanobacillus indicireducens]|uniref:HTH-type transcriptional regulator YhcF n=1 Tax=Oceanobacillus indicireducens TaxID=1004261 RepID=A0A917XVJ9_9BACI|nr:GntR family transcriptional regulator [Oceanobacillus indicireducens]GGN53288.1 putative HTH-type transcriptional regulator YhcF [Oceanobacillus indicireducens]
MADLFHSSKPIYEQIAELIKKQIIRGELHAGDKLPSVREMAIEVNVNPNTVQRTYRELESMEIARSKRGQGTFVTEDTEVLAAIREEMKAEILQNFTQQMYEMGYSKEEIKRGLADFLKERED